MKYKRFQKDSIAKIVKGYESDKHNNRFLVADEVGLGKTYIAKGVIRCLLYYHYLEEKQNSPDQTNFIFKVLYLCSNLNIAEQNKRKLGISDNEKSDFLAKCIKDGDDFQNYKKDSDDTGSSIENRTTMLLKQQISREENGKKIEALRKECIDILGEKLVEEKENKCNIEISNYEEDTISLDIIPITPNTSIKIRNGGHITERTFIRYVLNCVRVYIEKQKIEDCNLKNFISNIFRAKANCNQNYYLNDKEAENLSCLLPEFTNALSRLLANDKLNVNRLLYEYEGIVEKINVQQDDDWKKGWELLRKLFALASMELLQYDFVVMDEFQNFNDILQKANQTQISKQKYDSQISYIYNILDKCGQTDNDKIDILKKRIKDTFNDIEEKKLTAYEKKFWESKLSESEICESDLEKATTEDIIKMFLELSKPTSILEGSKQYESVLEEELELVKAILSNQNQNDGQIIWENYKALNSSLKDNFQKDKLASIQYYKEEIECTCKTEDVYGQKQLKRYFYPSSYELWNMNINEDCENFEQQYKYMRMLHPYGLKGVNCSKTPFDYFIYLFLKKDENSHNPALLLNCFQYFFKKNNQPEKCMKIWQYAHIISNLLAEDENRFHYTAEQLEPYRNMIGIYEKRISEDSDNLDEQMLLNHIFQNEVTGDNVTRILMLSATPFKMYDNNDEDDQKNANIMEVCDFLNQSKNISQKLLVYKNALLDYANSNGENGEFDAVKKKKQIFQDAMSNIFTRMERYAVLRSMNENWFDNMLSFREESGVGQSELPCGQIKELKSYLEEIKNMDVEKPFINFAVDSPYMGTFMHNNAKGTTAKPSDDTDGYKWKEQWKAKYKQIEYKEDSKVYISYETFKKNEKPLGLWHGVFNETLRKLLNLDGIKEEEKDNHPGAARLLWVPSCVNKDDLKGPFEEHKDYGKMILFSRYLMTPRMVACLTSYESRRRLGWKIKDLWKKKENKCFEPYIKELAEKLTINGKCANDGNQSEENGTYQYLKKVVGKLKEPLSKKLSAEDSFLVSYFDQAIKKYYDKNKKNANEMINDRLYELAEALTKAFADKVLLNGEQGLLAIWASYGFPKIELESSNDKIGSLVDACYEQIKTYCMDGALADVLAEWFYICLESDQDFGEFIGLKKGEFLSFIKESRITIDLYTEGQDGKIEEYKKGNEDKKLTNNAILYFARCIGMSKDDDNINAVKGLQQAFNSPFAPFVFATTSMGQEGLDFHYYADNIVHWKLPSNPVDFEQREGRINRYHCLAIRKKVLEWWSKSDRNTEDVYEVFNNAFDKAKNELTEENSNNKSIKNCELVPDWILLNEDKSESAQIRRIVPYFYLSKMAKEYNQTLRVLQLYRTVIGQGNPEEIMERLMSSKDTNEVKDLFVDFSPYWKNCQEVDDFLEDILPCIASNIEYLTDYWEGIDY